MEVDGARAIGAECGPVSGAEDRDAAECAVDVPLRYGAAFGLKH